jgi:hypothetical protein
MEAFRSQIDQGVFGVRISSCVSLALTYRFGP